MTNVTNTRSMLQGALDLAVTAGSLQPEKFQEELEKNISAKLLRSPSPPCLLRAPTGSGKTFVMTKVLERVSSERSVLWFWFVPFVTLVSQTLDSLLQHAQGLAPTTLAQGRNQDLGSGAVLISTAQAVARAQWRNQGYDADADDDVRTLAALVARARAKELQIGLVVDEAHIGLDHSTEFGKFARWLNPDYMLMATATPKDQRLTDFLASAGRIGQEHFSVSRDDVVKARLNKQYIEAVIYSIGENMQQVTDLRRTVLRQAWMRNALIGHRLRDAGVPCVPLLLVQVANGANSVDEAAQELTRLCKVPPEAIGTHTADKPDPVLMAQIANDPTKHVLVFKQSAGTGFDAPRAFVLASLKPVNDEDFAMQFIGRVMRVSRQIRERFPKPTPIPEELDTAYVYLGNAQAQAGFEAAVQATSAVRTQLEGQSEKLVTARTMNGAVKLTNRPTPELPLSYTMGLPSREEEDSPAGAAPTPAGSGWHPPTPTDPLQQDLLGEAGWTLDTVDTSSLPKATPATPQRPRTREQVLQTLADNGLRAFPLRRGLPALKGALKSEEKPSIVSLSGISQQIAQALPISATQAQAAVDAALNRTQQKEKHKELTQGKSYTQNIHVVTDRAALAREAQTALQSLPHAEEEDYRIIVNTLSERLRATVDVTLAESPDEAASPSMRVRLARDAAHWVIRQSASELKEAIFKAIVDQAKLVDAQPLPDVMIFPTDLALIGSSKNIYGVLPPSKDGTADVESVLFMDQRRWWEEQRFELNDGRVMNIGRYDGATRLNTLEQTFASCLDEAEFVHWWHRNPDKKPYSVRVVRAEHEHYFYPDFVVCVTHESGEPPMQRLIETKQDTKDAFNKAQHYPPFYGKVLFLTPDKERLRWVKDDGTLGDVVKPSEFQVVNDMLRRTKPASVPLDAE